MATIVKQVTEFYDELFNKWSDPRVDHFILMSSPWPVLFIVAAYNYFVHSLGAQLMRNREPLNVKPAMILYNLSQILLNGFFVTEGLMKIWIPMRYSLVCEEVDYSNDPFALYVARLTWIFFLSKVLDLLDTIFMVLRKKESQISFLHVYHHSGMVGATWVAAKYVAGGHVVFFGCVNAFVHVIMYSYYLMTALYPEYKKSLWWKKHITELQLAQFVITSIHGSLALLNPSCHFPKFLLAVFVPQDVFMFSLFWDFYKKAYLSKKAKESIHVKKCEDIKIANGQDNNILNGHDNKETIASRSGKLKTVIKQNGNKTN